MKFWLSGGGGGVRQNNNFNHQLSIWTEQNKNDKVMKRLILPRLYGRPGKEEVKRTNPGSPTFLHSFSYKIKIQLYTRKF